MCLGQRLKLAERGGGIWEQVERIDETVKGNWCWVLKKAMGLLSHYQTLF